ncbi:glutamine amidotransferase [Pseudoglutamicibacter cumminsii]|uniref:type 1 glutamine amidotransferase n=1 Tax=Pseudoglutamicibacter cumminsii TaxID=156979 RepID=UPI003083FA67|nr:CobQ-like glutamine amidotransferase family enzyme [Pseudoglutamicibacter cumminsii]
MSTANNASTNNSATTNNRAARSKELSGRKLSIVNVYQSLLGIYGDRGNAMVLAERARRRGADVTEYVAEPGSPVPDDADIYVLGGGEDGAQTAAVRALADDGVLARAVERGAVVFGVCAGYQILGETFTVGHDNAEREGLGLLNAQTVRCDPRAVGEIVTRRRGVSGNDALITGFENHGGQTRLSAGTEPLADVIEGVGNGDGTEGAVKGTVYGTYPHGPVLARNPALADELITVTTGVDLAPLPISTIAALRAERLEGHLGS